MTGARKPEPWTPLLLAGMYGLLLGNFALYRVSPLPLWLHVGISAAAIHLAFTIWHEAVHRNVFRSAPLDDAFGIAGIFPYMAPYFMSKWIHLEHHACLNQRDDPNLVYADGPFWTLPLRYPQAFARARWFLERDPRERWQRVVDALSVAAVAGIYALALWVGVFWDVVLLWLLPWMLAKVTMDWYINYLPHVGLPPHRFHGTRIVDVPWLTPLVLAHNYHAVHHLWPTIPWHRYRAVFRDKIDYLRRNGVPIEHRAFGRRFEPNHAGELSEGHLPR